MERTDASEERADRLEALEAEHGKLTETVLSLVTTVRRLAPQAGTLPPLTPVTGPRTGKDLAVDPAGDTSGDLVAWVSWLTERYELGATLPGCWPRHGALVEELHALRVGWRDTIGADEGDTVAMQWHYYLGLALDRIEHRWRTCTDGTHRAREPAEWLADGPDGADELDVDRDRFSAE